NAGRRRERRATELENSHGEIWCGAWAGLKACATRRRRPACCALVAQPVRAASGEDRVGVLVVVAIDEAIDGGFLGLERFEHGEQLRGLQDRVALRVEIQELHVAVAL